jgi:hypothetical protein
MSFATEYALLTLNKLLLLIYSHGTVDFKDKIGLGTYVLSKVKTCTMLNRNLESFSTPYMMLPGNAFPLIRRHDIIEPLLMSLPKNRSQTLNAIFPAEKTNQTHSGSSSNAANENHLNSTPTTGANIALSIPANHSTSFAISKDE